MTNRDFIPSIQHTTIHDFPISACRIFMPGSSCATADRRLGEMPIWESGTNFELAAEACLLTSDQRRPIVRARGPTREPGTRGRWGPAPWRVQIFYHLGIVTDIGRLYKRCVRLRTFVVLSLILCPNFHRCRHHEVFNRCDRCRLWWFGICLPLRREQAQPHLPFGS